MFISEYEHALDTKGRVSIPARFREVLDHSGEDRLILTIQDQGCLEAWPRSEWMKELERLRGMSRTNPVVVAYRRKRLGQAQEVQIDKQGRILLPTQLRQKVGLDKQLSFVGADDHFEIWDSERWSRALAESEELLSKNPNALSDLGH